MEESVLDQLHDVTAFITSFQAVMSCKDSKEEIVEAMRSFAVVVSRSDLKPKREAFQRMLVYVKSGSMPEAGVIAVVKLVLRAYFLRYQSYQSCKLAKWFFAEILRASDSLTVIKGTADACASILKPVSPQLHACGFRATAWLLTLIRFTKCKGWTPDTFGAVVDALSYASYLSASASDQQIKRLLLKYKVAFSEVETACKLLADAVLAADNSAEPNVPRLCFISVLSAVCHERKDNANVERLKHICRFFLMFASKQAFEEHILPHAKKFLLRNPEIVLSDVGILFDNLSIDLSVHAKDLVKPIGSLLYSKEAITRTEAEVAIGNLAARCSDKDAIEAMLQHLFGVLNGAEGKLTAATQRIGVIGGMATVSRHGASGQAATVVAAAAVEILLKILAEEGNETTLLATLKALAIWAPKFQQDQLPNKLQDAFKTLLKQQSSSVVRFACLQSMFVIYQGRYLQNAEPLCVDLLAVYDHGMKQTTQAPIVAESLAAAALLIRLSALGHHLDTSLKAFWANVFDKAPFLQRSFFISIDDETCLLLEAVGAKLLTEHSAEIATERLRNWYAILLHCLTQRPYAIRKAAKQTVQRLLNLLDGAHVASELLQLFHTLLDEAQQQEIQKRALLTAVKTATSTEAETTSVSPEALLAKQSRLFADALRTITSVPGCDPATLGGIALAALPLAAHPIIVRHDAGLWQKIVGDAVLARSLLIENLTDIFENMLDRTTPDEAQNEVRQLVKIQPEAIFGKILEHLSETLTDPAVTSVTHDELEMYRTPEGQLFDKSVLESLEKDEKGKPANLKRESKLYSYKDQMADFEIRKELEKKKLGKSGNTTEHELTPKQKEAMQQQLAKESLIRRAVAPIFEEVSRAFALLSAAVDGHPAFAIKYLCQLQRIVLPSVNIPVASSFAFVAWVRLSEIAFDASQRHTGYAIAYATLRMLDVPAFTLESAWVAEKLDVAVKRLIALLKNWRQTVKGKSASAAHPKGQVNGFASDSTAEEGFEGAGVGGANSALPSTVFAFTFPLFKAVLLGQAALPKEKANGELLDDTIDILTAKTSALLSDTRAEQLEALKVEMSLTPSVDAASLLLTLIGSASLSARIQQQCANCLSDLRKAVAKHLKLAEQEPGAIPLQELIELLALALENSSEVAREFSLRGLSELKDIVKGCMAKDAHLRSEIIDRLWIAQFDANESCKDLAEKLWQDFSCKLNEDSCLKIAESVVHSVPAVRLAAGVAVAESLKQFPAEASAVMDKFLEMYRDKVDQVIEPVKDAFGRVVVEGGVDDFESRIGVASALRKMSPLLADELVVKFFRAIVPDALTDRNANVRLSMLEAAISCVKEHGKEHVNDLLPMLEHLLDTCPDSHSADVLRQSLVVLMGTLAQHIENNDARVKPIVAKLIECLSTPSQRVQEAVANCLPPLIGSIKDQAPELALKLTHLLFEADQYGERRGAAYGIAGIVKGLGILSLKQLNIMQRIQEEIQNKKFAKRREGALLCFELLCTMLGRLFEPYIVNLLPSLLLCFGDPDKDVRLAAEDCSKAVMKQLSAHGVKLVLPSLLAALEEDSWRTKCGSVELLGAMAWCAPKQLSSCLPQIVPKLIEVLADTHLRVQAAGEAALKQIGKVVKNPEIMAILDVLLNALADPAKKTNSCLAVLLKTTFVHFMDAPSLALIMPILMRGFEDRSTESRKMAAQIIGNIYQLTDQKDVTPYLPCILPNLQRTLLDPVPEVRTVAAKALGSMIRGTMEVGFEELIPWLKQTLESETNSVDRSGAAQGLAEVLGGLGETKLNGFMPELLEIAGSDSVPPAKRDGYLMLFVFLPSVFGPKFLPQLPKVIPVLLHALSDENEYVRDTALGAGQQLINVYSETAIPLFLPSLEQGLFDDNWRIRFSSVQLIGDLLFKISGVTGKMTTEGEGEDDTFGSESSYKVITDVLGVDHRNRILAGLYMARSDIGVLVRQAASHVWKIIVSNTPRTLKDLLPTLFRLLLGCLASPSYDKQQIAARCLGELVRKMGERILIDIVPVLEQGLKSEDPDQRQGVCIALSEIMANTTKDMVLMYAENLIPTIKTALTDSLTVVRQAAAKTFIVLLDVMSADASGRASVMEEVLQPLLVKLDSAKECDTALDGLKSVTELKSRILFPYLIPKLIAPRTNAKALAELAEVSTDTLSKHLPKLLPALLTSLAATIENYAKREEEANYCLRVLLAASDDAGVNLCLDVLLTKSNSDKESLDIRNASVLLLLLYCQQSGKINLKSYTETLLKGLIRLLRDENEDILNHSADALIAITKTLDAREQADHVSSVRTALKQLLSDVKPNTLLPGFCTGKGLHSVITILREGILSGNAELKEVSATALSEVIGYSSDQGLKPHVINVTGPLIRILGDRYPPAVKNALLGTLALLIDKVGVMIKPFLPQLQSTFVKALADPSARSVRLKAGTALAAFCAVHPKFDAMTVDAFNGAKTADDSSVKETYLVALRGIFATVRDKLTPETRSLLAVGLPPLLALPDDAARMAAGAALGALVADVLTAEEAAPVIREHILGSDQCMDATIRHGGAIALQVSAMRNAAKLAQATSDERLQKALISHITSDKIPVCMSGLRAAAFYLRHQIKTKSQSDISTTLVTTLARSINHSSNDVKTLTALICKYLAASYDAPLDFSLLKVIVPCMLNGSKEKNSAVRCASEEALVGLLRLRSTSGVYNKYLSESSEGGRESLAETYAKVLQKLAASSTGSDACEDNELDDTVRG